MGIALKTWLHRRKAKASAYAALCGVVEIMAGRILTVTMLLASVSVGAGATIDFRGLLDEMVDRSRIAEFPQPAFVCKQASSYNRKAETPGNPNWFAGADFDQFYGSRLAEGRKEWIMLEADGPGVVTRWWQTQYRSAGMIRVYLDGAREPIFQGTGAELLGGAAIVGPPLGANRGGGLNLYLPIPFSQHCRITFESTNTNADFTTKSPNFKNESLFYNINYLLYPKSAKVKTLTRSELEASRELIASVGRTLLEPSQHPLPGQRKIQGGKDALRPGQSLASTVQGSRAISVLKLRLHASDITQAMRSTVITASFDGKQTVWAPVGEFFGSGLGVDPYQDWWRRVGKDGWMTCWWPMPFKKSAEVRVTNYGTNQLVEVEFGDLEIADWKWTDRTMYFHTAWRSGNRILFGSNSNPKDIKDWNYVTISGKGVFVGDSLSLYNRPVIGGPLGAWWGEGDEKIFVDEELFPSHFGTGSEDYYGYAFNSTTPFSAPFHAQPVAKGNLDIGHTTNERVRVHDRIPFQTGFKFDMELYHWQPNVKNDYATTTHWYAFEGGTDNGQTTPETVREAVAQRWTGPDDMPASKTKEKE